MHGTEAPFGVSTLIAAQQAGSSPPVTPPRTLLLEEAIKITSTDRNTAYGPPEDNFKNIADRWNLYLAQRFQSIIPTLQPIDVAFMMIDMKMARLGPNPVHRDSLVDVAGYAACAADCQEAMARRSLRAAPDSTVMQKRT